MHRVTSLPSYRYWVLYEFEISDELWDFYHLQIVPCNTFFYLTNNYWCKIYLVWVFFGSARLWGRDLLNTSNPMTSPSPTNLQNHSHPIPRKSKASLSILSSQNLARQSSHRSPTTPLSQFRLFLLLHWAMSFRESCLFYFPSLHWSTHLQT